MRSRPLVIIAGVCVLVLTVAGMLVIPGTLPGYPSSAGAEDEIVVMPGHWWRTSLDERQIELLRRLWCTDISRKGLVDALWPGVMQELPVAARALWESEIVNWPDEPFDDWRGVQAWAMSAMASAQDGPIVFDVYFGCDGWETDDMFTVSRSIAIGLASDNRYRISMYTDDVLGCPDGAIEEGRRDGV